MSSKSKFLDYEPISNSRGFEPEATSVSSTDSQSPSEEREPQADRVIANRVGSAGILKKGHGLTFASLFLFTFLLLFRPYEFSTSLSWLHKGALITAIVTLMFFIPTQLALEGRLTVRTREINLVFLLLLFCLISVPFALDNLRAWNGFVEYLKVIIIFVVMVNVLRSEKQLKALLLLTLVATCFLSFSALLDYRAGNLALRGMRIEGAIGGLFQNPNDLALHFVTFLPIIFVMGLASRNVISRILYFTAALAALGGTIVTFSRGGFVGLIFVVGALVWKLGRRHPLLLGAIFLSLVMTLLILVPGTYRERISTTGDGSTVARIGELKRSIFLAVRNPVFGVGMDNYVLFSDREQGTHNSYTQVAAEIGFAGALIYLLFLIVTLRRVAKMPDPKEVDRRKRLLPYLAIGVQASLVGYMVTSFFASVAFFWYVYYLAAYGICISRLYESSLAAESNGQGKDMIAV